VNGIAGAKDRPRAHADQTTAARLFPHLGVEEPRLWPPSELGHRPRRLTAVWLHPLAGGRDPCREVLPKAIGEP
jgi:hypothetical protein